MKRIIGPQQNNFLPGRSTLDNIIFTQELVHSMHKRKGKKGLRWSNWTSTKPMTVSTRAPEAYHSVSETVIDTFNFPKSLTELILFGIKKSGISILQNGDKLPPFNPKRGHRQVDPLNPYLFIIVMEWLSHDIQSEVATGSWKPILLNRGRTMIFHLFFVDDLMLFGEATEW